jgi:hypothetical protein
MTLIPIRQFFVFKTNCGQIEYPAVAEAASLKTIKLYETKQVHADNQIDLLSTDEVLKVNYKNLNPPHAMINAPIYPVFFTGRSFRQLVPSKVPKGFLRKNAFGKRDPFSQSGTFDREAPG